MPRRIDDHPAHSRAQGTLFQVYARDRDGKTYQVTPPSSLAVVKLVIETLSPGMAHEGVVLWLERLGGKGGLSERYEIEEKRLQARAVAQRREGLEVGAVETDIVGAVETDIVGAVETDIVGAVGTDIVGAVETDIVGAVETDLMVCAGRRYPVNHEEVQRLIIEDLKKWTVFGLFMILGGFLVLLIHQTPIGRKRRPT